MTYQTIAPNTTHSTAHYLLEGICDVGIDYLFCNLGTDHAPIVEELAHWRSLGRQPPEVVICPHEVVAVHMAAGYAMATGRGQAVLVHVDAGTANAAMSLHNLSRSRVPVLLLAGKAPFTLRGELLGSRDTAVNFAQEPFDIASLVRPYSKWTYDLPSGLIVKEVIRRAHTVMQSDPMGPVYMTAAREILTAGHPPGAIQSFSEMKFGPVRACGVDDETISLIADKLLAAENPILITSYAGRNPEAPALLEALGRFAGMGVYESNPLYLNISRKAPCFGGFLAGEAVAAADFGLLVDVDTPWIPKFTRENANTFWAQIDVDAVKKDCPMWGFPTHLRVQADSVRVLRRLLEVLEAKAPAAWRKAAAERLGRWAGAAEAAAGSQVSLQAGAAGEMSPSFVCAELAKALDDDAILVQEAISNLLPVLTNIPRTRPGTYFANGGGGLGFGGGVALGAKLANPEQMVVNVTGDGSFCFSAPSAVLAVAKRYKLPTLTVVLDNAGWGAVKAATRRVYPDGEAAAAGAYCATYADDMRWEKVAEVADAYGERVEAPGDLPDAIQRCLAEVRRGRAAVLVAAVEKVSQG